MGFKGCHWEKLTRDILRTINPLAEIKSVLLEIVPNWSKKAYLPLLICY